jgi:hypothetical protein
MRPTHASRTRWSNSMCGSGTPGEKMSGAACSKQIGATGRYASRRLISFSRTFMPGLLGSARMLR